ncbi:MAG: 3-hydroxyacyl-ACP dehydratase FabZ [Magnetococcales bacterium]|nr:3-hydroxyacyl-ACP dehydratase FabZ [Magnetococcales bacterium]
MDYLNNPEAILKSLPHRYPFLMIDRIVDVVEGKTLTAIKNVTFNEPHFMGHFPDNPVMPGVLILEAMAQAGALFAAHNDPESTEGCLVYFMSIDKARFRKPVVPGDQLRIEITLLKRRRDIWRFQGNSFVEDKLVSEAEFMAMTRKDDQ